jgi:hypothetical protein
MTAFSKGLLNDDDISLKHRWIYTALHSAAGDPGIFRNALRRKSWRRSERLPRRVTDTSGWHWVALACLILFFTCILNFTLIWQPYSDSDLTIAEQFKRNPRLSPECAPGSARKSICLEGWR